MKTHISYLQNHATEWDYYPACNVVRFGNFIIDLAVVYFICMVAGVFVSVYNGPITSLNNISASSLDIMLLIIPVTVYVLYYGLMETFNHGRTVGKIATGSFVVDVDGKPVSMKTAFKRALVRMIPFEPLTIFGGRPLHDLWTGTKVFARKKQL